MRRVIWVLLGLLGLGRAARAEQDVDFVTESGIRVEGTRLADMTAMASQIDRVRKAVRAVFDLEIGDIPVHLVSIDNLKRLWDEGGVRMRGGVVQGFEYKGHVFVRRGLAGVPDEVLIHECLHASSQRFGIEANLRGVHKLVEGVTEYLTLQAMAARGPIPGLRNERQRVYVAFTRLAETLATLVGEKALRAAYFRDGFEALAARVDKVTGGRRRLLQAAQLLEAGDEQGATAHLLGSRR